MGKIITTTDGTQFERVSRWITVNIGERITKRNNLYEFSTDENGYNPSSDRFDPKNGVYIDYFKHDGKKYSLSQFVALGSVWCGGVPYMYEDDNGELGIIGAVDFYGDLYTPLYAELSECCEQIRLYRMV